MASIHFSKTTVGVNSLQHAITVMYDWSVVTRFGHSCNTQKWNITGVGKDAFTIQTKHSMRYLDARNASNDGNAVTRSLGDDS